MKFILCILMFGIFLNSNITEALTPNKEDISSLFGVCACYPIYHNSFIRDNVNTILIESNSSTNNAFLDDSTINYADNFSSIYLLKKDIETLNKELDKLNHKLSNLESENQQLKLTLEKINIGEQNRNRKDSLINELQNEARRSRANNMDQYIPDEYIKALDLLIIGDIDLANRHFEVFLVKNSGNKDNDLNTNGKTKINIIYVAYANYWLGKINIIESNYNKAVQYFVECYKITSSNILSLMSLIGLIDSLTNLAKPNEACTAIKQFIQDYQKASKEKDFHFPDSYLKLIENYKSINKCH